MSVWVAQCLCPQRHCIMAVADVADDEGAAQLTLLPALRATVNEWLRSGAANPWCALCHASAETWRFEVGDTKLATMEQAAPVLRQSEREQAMTRDLFGDLPRSD
jgi:hypothetical protein